MAKLLKIFGKKAPHPPRPDYTGGPRKGKGSVSDSDEELLHQQHTLPAYLTESPPAHGSPGHTVDRLRHASQSSQDSGTGMESTQAVCPISPTKQNRVSIVTETDSSHVATASDYLWRYSHGPKYRKQENQMVLFTWQIWLGCLFLFVETYVTTTFLYETTMLSLIYVIQ